MGVWRDVKNQSIERGEPRVLYFSGGICGNLLLCDWLYTIYRMAKNHSACVYDSICIELCLKCIFDIIGFCKCDNVSWNTFRLIDKRIDYIALVFIRHHRPWGCRCIVLSFAVQQQVGTYLEFLANFKGQLPRGEQDAILVSRRRRRRGLSKQKKRFKMMMRSSIRNT